ncbi:uncharacterized protein DUF1203 [Litoreibacter ponti]|uniref:Uncharacterized protein DUF1203 n=1 Tax=Litoreibacter ponti TaxID=1510457 RepID=A0A2T6BHX0_9RHOB|nr:DUF1203 domain-containing protein [Litoreibacter ponti]PTX55655.1 uncharacterized protein DUF1203 [Litoreibacter ponti]
MRFTPYNLDFIQHIRAGGTDANGQLPERAISDGQGKPCRCCLDTVPAGEEMLILAARPFPAPQPYAETGPIFFCAKDCTPFAGDGVPPILTASPDYLVKGYTADHRIRYGTGQITPADEVETYARTLFETTEIAYVDVRSARNNCFLTRIPRDG